MIRNEILTLQKERIYPSITILMPTSRITIDASKEKILLKNLLNELEEKLKHKVNKKEAKILFDKVNEITRNIDFFNLKDGLGIFVNERKSFLIQFPFSVPPMTVVDDTFETKFLIKQYNRSIEYYLLNLKEKETGLFYGFNEILEPIINEDFPFQMEDVVDLVYEQGTWHYDSAIMERYRQYIREASKRLKKYIEGNTPIIIAGVNKLTSLFEELSDCKSLIGKIEGSYDSKNLFEIGQKADKIIKDHLAKLRLKILNEFKDNLGIKKASYGLLDIWNLANEGRVETLLVEENYHQPAKFEGNQPVFVNDTSDSLLIEDLVDETIELVFTQKGNVYFYENGALKEYQSIGAILRY